jgi:predicted nucleotidyltransferase component of viral defense system
MNVEIIKQRLLEYQCKTVLEQENALKEIAQEIALLSLSNSDFFKYAAFQGGTCLRILYGLNRFSEDLDFILNTPNLHFNIEPFIRTMKDDFLGYGYDVELVNKNKLNKTVKMAFIKAESTGGLLLLKDARTNRAKIQIKLEIDTNPPAGSNDELKYLDFPLPYSILVQDLPSLFAGKCHALLCRDYIKGRDWYDFIWYVSRKSPINFSFLKFALEQKGPWEGQIMNIDKKWIIEQLSIKIKTIDWDNAKADVSRFLSAQENKTLELWSHAFFSAMIDKLANNI